MDGLSAVATDNAVETPEAAPVETPDGEPTQDTSETPDEAQPEQTEESADGADAGEGDQEVTGDGRVIPQQYRELFKTDKTLKAMFFENREVKAMFPGGVPEIRELQQVITDLGGREGLESMRAEADQLQAIAEMVRNGDAQIVQNMAQTSPEGFSKIAPAFLSTWHQVDSEGCNAALCGVIANTLRDSGFESQMTNLGYALKYGDTEAAQQIIDGLKKWSGNFATAAQNVPSRAPQQDTKFQEREQQISQREEQIFQREAESATGNVRDSAYDSAIKAALNGRDCPPEKRDLIWNEMVRQAQSIAQADKSYVKQFNSAWANKDVPGLQKIVNAKLKDILPDIATKTTRLILGAPAVKPKPAPVAAKPATAKPATSQPNKYGDPVKDAIANIFTR